MLFGGSHEFYKSVSYTEPDHAVGTSHTHSWLEKVLMFNVPRGIMGLKKLTSERLVTF